MVLDRVSEAALMINPEKSEFCCSEVTYLGFVVNKDSQIDSDEVEPITSYPAPKTVKQLRRFIGMSSWYRRFIPEFATVAEPLNLLFRTNVKWHSGEEQQEALDNLKRALTGATILAYPRFRSVVENLFHLQADANATGLGVVLTQMQDEEERVIALASRPLLTAERNYTVTVREY